MLKKLKVLACAQTQKQFVVVNFFKAIREGKTETWRQNINNFFNVKQKVFIKSERFDTVI